MRPVPERPIVPPGGVAGHPASRRAAFAAFVLAVASASSTAVERVFGPSAHVPLLVACAALVSLAFWIGAPARPPRRTAGLALAAVLASLAVAFLVLYPRWNVHGPGIGADRDDALEQATRLLLAGEYPYAARTYLGSPVTPMPGGLILSAPFQLLGNIAAGNLFWICGLSLLLARRCGAWGAALVVGAAFASPGGLGELVTGGDLLANSIALLLGAAFVLATASRAATAPPPVAARVLLGLALAWRPTGALLLPALWSALRCRAGMRRASVDVAAAIGVACAVTLPFLLPDPSRFSPLHVVSKVDAVPLGRFIVPAAAAAAAIAGALRADGSLERVARAAFWALWVPTSLVALATHASTGTFGTVEHGPMTLAFAAVGFGPAALEVARRRDGSAAASTSPAPP